MGGAATVLCHIRKWVGPPPGDEPTDGQLLERFVAQRDAAALAELVQRHGRLVYNLCLRILHDGHEADDAFQATFFVLAQKAGAIRQRASLASWLHGVAYRIAVRARVQARARAARASEDIDMAQPDPAREAAWRELRPLLDGELERLPEKYKAPLLLCYFEGRSNDEAARLLGWPSGTVKGRLARARELLRRRLAERGLALSLTTVTACLGEQAMAAPTPTCLLDSTIKATLQLVAGSATPAGCISAQAVAFSKGELHSMFITQFRMVTAFVLLTGVGAWVSLCGYQAWADKPTSATSLLAAFQNAPRGFDQADTAGQAAAAPAGFEGRWTAKVEIGSDSALVRIELLQEAGKWKGTVRISKDKMFDLKNLKIAGNKISFEVDADELDLSLTGELKDGTVTGTLEALGKKDGIMEGTWTMSRR